MHRRADYLDKLQMKAEIKRMLRGSMNNYFDPASFMLDLQIESIEITPDKHHFPKMEEEIAIAELPGIPFVRIPRLSVTETDLSISEETRGGGSEAFKRMRINIYADIIYGASDLDFMRMLATLVLQINEDAGDEINIIQIAMPRLTQLERRMEQPGEPEAVAEVEKAAKPIRFDGPPVLHGKTTSASPLARMIWPGVIIFIIVVLMVLSALYLLKKRRFNNPESLQSGSENDITSTVANRRAGGPSNETLIKPGKGSDAGDPLQKDLLFVTSCFLEHTNALALLFESWINRNEAEGASRIARIINMLDPRYIKLFEGLISKDAHKKIEEAMQDPENGCMDMDNKLIGRFSEELKRFLHPGASKGISTFYFLHHLDNDTLLDLCHKLEPAECSILLDNLPDEKVCAIFERLGPDIVARLITTSARRKRIDFKQVDTLAERCFAFFREHKAEKEYNARNLDRLTRLLEALHIDRQEQFLKSIRAGDPGLHEMIHGRMLTWNKLTGMEPHVLKAALATTDSRTLAFAWADTDTKEKILSLRSKREQLLIRELMLEASRSPANIKEKAKQTVLQTVRKHLQSNLQHPTSNLQHLTSNI